MLLRYMRDGEPRRGSGLRIGGTYVLTADHCANGTGHTVVVGGRDYPATVALRSGHGEVDIAVLSAPDLPVLPRLSCARVNTGIAARIKDCVALGFPTWNRLGGVDRLAQADGYAGTGEGADPRAGSGGVPLLALKITTPAIKDRTVAAGDLSEPTSPWGGMSGAVIVSGGAQINGVVRGHAPATGVGSLTFTPLAAIDLLPRQTAEGLWASLGVADPKVVPVLPVLDVVASGAIVVGEIPRQPQAFVERETAQRLAAALGEAGVAVVCALTGLRGGKTQVCASSWRRVST
ncbi:MAG TPA: hypothetical protein VE197_18700 [Mycobacterium sp.]|nr:hypothetical protein [Mycobacterium sp.]